MNSVLERIVQTQKVTDGSTTLPLRHPDFPQLAVAVDMPEGAFLQRLVNDVKPKISLEIGCAYGVSTLYICESLSRVSSGTRHIVIDPFQSSQWRGIGRKNVEDAGFGALVDFREDCRSISLSSTAGTHSTRYSSNSSSSTSFFALAASSRSTMPIVVR